MSKKTNGSAISIQVPGSRAAGMNAQIPIEDPPNAHAKKEKNSDSIGTLEYPSSIPVLYLLAAPTHPAIFPIAINTEILRHAYAK